MREPRPGIMKHTMAPATIIKDTSPRSNLVERDRGEFDDLIGEDHWLTVVHLLER